MLLLWSPAFGDAIEYGIDHMTQLSLNSECSFLPWRGQRFVDLYSIGCHGYTWLRLCNVLFSIDQNSANKPSVHESHLL